MPDLRLLRNVRIPAFTAGGACVVVAAALLLNAAASPAQDFPSTPAQDISSQAPAHINVIDGDVVLDREVESGPADVGMPVVPGDRLRTRRGRAELLFPDGSALDVDEFTSVDLQASQLIRVTDGRVRLTVPRDSTTRYQIDTPAATAYIDAPGEYRVGLLGTGTVPQAELAVIRGHAELVGDRGSVILAAGERSLAWANDLPSRPEPFNSARYDAFDRWASAHRDERPPATAVQYLPPDLRVYGGTLARDGSWQYESAYGYVWYPTVDASWRPYYTGYWATVPSYGWTWIGIERWSWPTHHYGRWGHAHDRWFWIPDRRWAPAWVSWGAAPGYVSWCPLGYDNRPVFQLSVSAGRGWDGWVVLPRERFGIRGERVNRYAVGPRDLSPRTPFIVQTTPPVAPPRAAVLRGRGTPPAGNSSPDGNSSQRNSVGSIIGAPDAARRERAPSGSGTAVPRPRVPDSRPGPPANGGAVRQPSPQGSSPDAGTRASRENSAGRARAVPRAGTPEPRQVPDAASRPDGATQDRPRFSPFGDFRRPGSVDAAPPARTDTAPAESPRAAPRQRPVEQPRAGQADEQAGRPPGSSEWRRSPSDAQAAQAPQAAPAGASRPQREGSSGGAIGRTPGNERNGGGGSATGRTNRQESGSSAGRDRAAGTGSAPSNDGQREHAPESRRPRR